MRITKPISMLLTLLSTTALVFGDAAAGAPGVDRNTIRIGVHAPLTGASPVPARSAEQGADIYWRWRRAKGNRINGRHVNVVFKNDNYNPSQAVAVCKEMVERDNVFILSGLMNPEGKDQIQACARYAASVGVPYVSLGVTKVGLEIPNYFTLSMTWPAQSRLLADFFVDRLRGKRRDNGMVRHDTPNYSDSHEAFIQAMRRRNADVVYDRAISNGAGQTEAQIVVQELKAAEVDNVFVLTRPVWFLQLLDAATNHNYHPRWTGIGITMTITDEVAKVGCRSGRSIQGAKFFSPLPAFAGHNEFDPTYERAMKRVYGERGDAMSWLGWATSRHLGKLLDNAGRRLTRKRFIERTERARKVRTGIMPRLNFTPRDHFGGAGTHVLTAKCRDRKWHTTARFKRRF